LHVEARMARIRDELAPEKVARGGHGGTPRYSAPSTFCTTSKRYSSDLPLLFGTGAVKGRVTRGAEREGGDSVQHLGRHQGRELHRGGPHQPLVAYQQEQGDGGAMMVVLREGTERCRHLDKAVSEPPLALARGVEPDRVRDVALARK
jgi:hypothetical protein